MANLSPYLAIEQMTLDPTQFLTVAAPVDCDHLVLRDSDGNNLYIRSDPSNPATQDMIPGGAEQTFSEPKGEFSAGTPRYRQGQSIVALKPAAGTGPAILKFLA